MSEEGGIHEEVVGLSYHFLPPERQAEVDTVLRALQQDAALEFMLAVFDVELNDRRIPAAMPPARRLLRKLLQALDEEEGESLLYDSPYNELGVGPRGDVPRIEWWNFDLGDRLCRFPELRSIRAFLEHGTGRAPGRPAAEAQFLHDLLLHGLVGESTGHSIWGCTDVQTPGTGYKSDCPAEQIWPAEDVSPWFHGVFWDDLLFVLNPPEGTLAVLAVTSR